ncbi:hypothetical protein MTR_5g082010 [Medicago truncatula]|uniref:Uncharacterized protein n=1 Tax=Medicago truncatula TaxID=3880 RepID=G7KBY5_MEDTR|nr:hypothetical protein MTR_5g082010 [Medicago truncatula]
MGGITLPNVALDIEYHHNILLSHRKVNSKEVIVSNFLCQEAEFAAIWYIWMEYIDNLNLTTVDKIPSDLEAMEASMAHILTLIDDNYKYIDDVLGFCCSRLL